MFTRARTLMLAIVALFSLFVFAIPRVLSAPPGSIAIEAPAVLEAFPPLVIAEPPQTPTPFPSSLTQWQNIRHHAYIAPTHCMV